MKRRRKIKQRQKRERRLFLRRRSAKRERVQRQKQIAIALGNAQPQKPKPLDFGHKKEVLVAQLINALACYSYYTWIARAAQSNQIEDGDGKDVIVHTTQGNEFYLQIKSSIEAAEKFVRGPHSKQYKKMYLVAHPDNEKPIWYSMPSPNSNAYAFIIIVVVYRKKNVSEEIEDIDLVLKKIKIALDIIKQYVD